MHSLDIIFHSFASPVISEVLIQATNDILVALCVVSNRKINFRHWHGISNTKLNVVEYSCGSMARVFQWLAQRNRNVKQKVLDSREIY